MKQGTSITVAVICTATLLFITSCQCNRNTTTDEFDETSSNTDTLGIDAEDDLNKSKTILYTLPSPVEMASLISKSGVVFDEELLNDISKANQYNGNLKMSLNLGIYACDMSLASLFNQSQKTVEYLGSLKSITERLGIVQIVNEETIQRFEDNKSSKDEILSVISDLYLDANQYLNENNRRNIAVMTLIGGWTEGLYLALNMMDPAGNPNVALTERIMAQKLALATVMSILADSNKNNASEDLNYLHNKMTEIKILFDEVRIEPIGKITATVDAENKTTWIKANCQSKIPIETLQTLKNKVTEIRNEFTD